MARVVASWTLDQDGVDALLQPRGDLLLERPTGDRSFEALEGPVAHYRRVVDVEPADEGRSLVTQTIDFRLAVPYFGWLFVLPFKWAMARPPGERPPWWAPPSRLDARAATVLGALAALGVVFGYLNTLFTQTIAFAGEEFESSNSALGFAGAVVRVGGVVALAVAALADRHGRRRVLMPTAFAGCLLALTGALAPSLPWLTTSQMLARAFGTALLILVAIVAAEEMPAGSRAYAVGLLAMAGGLGAGVCVTALNLADLDLRGWRLLYVIPVLGLPIVASVARQLPETRRFSAPHRDARVAGHGQRLWLLAASGLLVNLFVAPQSQFGNRFLRTERGFSGGRIGLFALVTGTPAALGIVVGGRLADVRGRRVVAAVALAGGAACTVLFFFSSGWPLWAWSVVGTTISAASIPALGVYGPELFPTSLRGRANGIVGVLSLAGSAAGLLLAGTLSDQFGRIAPAMAFLAAGPALVALLVLIAYPETAGLELEELNPEDRPPP